MASSYVEAVAVDHCKRWAPNYYIKGDKGEVDIAVIQGTRIFPVEVKWTKNIRPEDLKEIQRFPRGILLNQCRTQHGEEYLFSTPGTFFNSYRRPAIGYLSGKTLT